MKMSRLIAFACLALVACGGDDDPRDPTEPVPPEVGPDGELIFRSAPDLPLEDPGIAEDQIIIAEPGFVADLRVDLDIEHTRVFELRVFLEHVESGVQIDMVRNPRSEADNMTFQLRDGAANDVQNDVAFEDPQGPAYTADEYNPNEPLGFFYSDELAGTWRLGVSDRSGGDTGRLRSWALRIDVAEQAPPARLIAANPRRFFASGGVGVTQDQFVQYRYTGASADAPTVSVVAGNVDAVFFPIAGDEPVKGGAIAYSADNEGERDLEFELAIDGVADTISWSTAFAELRASGMTLVSQLSPAQLGYPGFEGNDCWGWTDPQTGTEWALMATEAGVSFVDLSDPANPVVAGKLDTHTVPSAWRDVKIYQDHAFVVSEASEHGMQVFDLSELRELDGSSIVSLEETVHFDGFGKAHNIVIDEQSGFAYVVGANQDGFDGQCGGGLYMIDITSPTAPVDAGCFGGADPVQPEQGTEYPTSAYVHDAQCVTYDGPDTDYVGQQLCVSSDGQVDETGLDFLAIADVTDKDNVVQVARIEYAEPGYAHQGWLSEDHRYFFLNDEFDEFTNDSQTRTLVFDLVDLEQPVQIGVFENPSLAVGHNAYVLGGLLYMANYTSGLRVVDLNADEQGVITVGGMEEVSFLDTYPDDDAFPFEDEDPARAGFGVPAFSGAWSNYPFFESANIVVSDIERGLFIVR